MLSEVLYNQDIVRDLEPDEIIEKFLRGAGILALEPPLVRLEATEGEVVFVGDTHGDFSVTKYITNRFLREADKYLVFLGDYIDREPEPEGSLFNLLYLCLLKIEFPKRVFLLKGNHEAHYAFFCYPYQFDKSLVDIFGTYGRQIHAVAIDFFKEMPLMFKTCNGIIAAHAGFPLHGQSIDDKSRKDLIVDILWADAQISPMFRGFDIPKFSEEQLTEFLNKMNAKCFIRGHDPFLAGKSIYSKRCITLSTSRSYVFRGGMKIAKANLGQPVKNTDHILIEDITSCLAASE
ncbi:MULTISPECIES: metallophosphoesterase [Thermodesulfovibrio]|jgi:hypothetical protein|uniref:metallophosphoesterase n=1 Tax=Thermodesulfovibrio TaxID=28261 RepID=UPI002605CBAD|nr:metallophosphoesterase [Thermodesulfovibrio sp.]